MPSIVKSLYFLLPYFAVNTVVLYGNLMHFLRPQNNTVDTDREMHDINQKGTIYLQIALPW